MTVYDRIKELAERRKMSVAEVEKALDMGVNSLYAWKKKIPNGASLEKAADYFHVTVDYLLGRDADYTFEDIPFDVKIEQNEDREYHIIVNQKAEAPADLLRKIRDSKSRIEKKINTFPEFNIDDPALTPFRVEQLFIDDLYKNKVYVVSLKNIAPQKVDLAELAKKKEPNWDNVLSAGGKPLTDKDKAMLTAMFYDRDDS